MTPSTREGAANVFSATSLIAPVEPVTASWAPTSTVASQSLSTPSQTSVLPGNAFASLSSHSAQAMNPSVSPSSSLLGRPPSQLLSAPSQTSVAPG